MANENKAVEAVEAVQSPFELKVERLHGEMAKVAKARIDDKEEDKEGNLVPENLVVPRYYGRAPGLGMVDALALTVKVNCQIILAFEKLLGDQKLPIDDQAKQEIRPFCEQLKRDTVNIMRKDAYVNYRLRIQNDAQLLEVLEELEEQLTPEEKQNAKPEDVQQLADEVENPRAFEKYKQGRLDAVGLLEEDHPSHKKKLVVLLKKILDELSPTYEAELKETLIKYAENHGKTPHSLDGSTLDFTLPFYQILEIARDACKPKNKGVFSGGDRHQTYDTAATEFQKFFRKRREEKNEPLTAVEHLLFYLITLNDQAIDIETYSTQAVSAKLDFVETGERFKDKLAFAAFLSEDQFEKIIEFQACRGALEDKRIAARFYSALPKHSEFQENFSKKNGDNSSTHQLSLLWEQYEKTRFTLSDARRLEEVRALELALGKIPKSGNKETDGYLSNVLLAFQKEEDFVLNMLPLLPVHPAIYKVINAEHPVSDQIPAFELGGDPGLFIQGSLNEIARGNEKRDLVENLLHHQDTLLKQDTYRHHFLILANSKSFGYPIKDQKLLQMIQKARIKQGQVYLEQYYHQYTPADEVAKRATEARDFREEPEVYFSDNESEGGRDVIKKQAFIFQYLMDRLSNPENELTDREIQDLSNHPKLLQEFFSVLVKGSKAFKDVLPNIDEGQHTWHEFLLSEPHKERKKELIKAVDPKIIVSFIEQHLNQTKRITDPTIKFLKDSLNLDSAVIDRSIKAYLSRAARSPINLSEEAGRQDVLLTTEHLKQLAEMTANPRQTTIDFIQNRLSNIAKAKTHPTIQSLETELLGGGAEHQSFVAAAIKAHLAATAKITKSTEVLLGFASKNLQGFDQVIRETEARLEAQTKLTDLLDSTNKEKANVETAEKKLRDFIPLAKYTGRLSRFAGVGIVALITFIVGNFGIFSGMLNLVLAAFKGGSALVGAPLIATAVMLWVVALPLIIGGIQLINTEDAKKVLGGVFMLMSGMAIVGFGFSFLGALPLSGPVLIAAAVIIGVGAALNLFVGFWMQNSEPAKNDLALVKVASEQASDAFYEFAKASENRLTLMSNPQEKKMLLDIAMAKAKVFVNGTEDLKLKWKKAISELLEVGFLFEDILKDIPIKLQELVGVNVFSELNSTFIEIKNQLMIKGFSDVADDPVTIIKNLLRLDVHPEAIFERASHQERGEIRRDLIAQVLKESVGRGEIDLKNNSCVDWEAWLEAQSGPAAVGNVAAAAAEEKEVGDDPKNYQVLQVAGFEQVDIDRTIAALPSAPVLPQVKAQENIPGSGSNTAGMIDMFGGFGSAKPGEVSANNEVDLAEPREQEEQPLVDSQLVAGPLVTPVREDVLKPAVQVNTRNNS